MVAPAGKHNGGKPKFPAINGGGRGEGRKGGGRPGCMFARGCTGNSPRDLVLAIRKARLVGRASCPVCLREVAPSPAIGSPPLAPFYLSPRPPIVLFLPIFRRPSYPYPPAPFLSAPRRAYIRVFLFLHAAAAASAPSSLATQTSINFAGSGPTVFQFRVSTVNASAFDRQRCGE